MRRLSIIIFVALVCANVWGLTIPKGTFYFDNSKTRYEQVKFVYGSDTSSETYVVSMTHDTADKWSVTFEQSVENMYRYTFAATTLPDGKINDTFPNVKEDISKVRNEMRTATTDATIIVGGTFTPTSGDNWAQGSWVIDNDGRGYSKTLPVMFINTENSQSITSKEDYINATYYLETFDLEGYEAFGTESQQLPLEIRGRGNYTWRDFEKKPYRIKLGSKAALLGMNKSKHFALLAHADDNLGFYRNTMGFEFSRRLDMPYTPAHRPVEVVLNGNYIGLYFLTETIRVDEDRVNIVEQEDYATDAQAITGGWLVEIDNYDEAEQVRITEGNGVMMRFTYKTPELLSDAQRTYLTEQMNAIDDAIYLSDKNSTDWEELVDMQHLVRFYVTQELMQNAESFHGSCYLYKDLGDDEKWHFGPVWDFGNSFHNGENRFIYINSPFGNHWIEEFAKFPRFQEMVKSVWADFYRNEVASIDAFMNEFADKIAVAAVCDYARWPQYGASDIYAKKEEMKRLLDDRIEWLNRQWEDTGIDAKNLSETIVYGVKGGIVAPESAEIYNLNGCKVSAVNLPAGVYIVRLGSQARKVLVR